MYRDIITSSQAMTQIAGTLKIIANAKGATLVHCSAAGKDRTGIVVALALTLAGADLDDVYADYLYSEHAVTGQEAGLSDMAQSVNLPAGVLDTALGVDRSYLEAALDEMQLAHGTVDQYLAVAGVDAQTRSLLCQKIQ